MNFLLSHRSSAWGSLGFRALLALAYLAMPDCTEIAYGSNCAQWPMALGAILLVVAAVPGALWRAGISNSSTCFSPDSQDPSASRFFRWPRFWPGNVASVGVGCNAASLPHAARLTCARCSFSIPVAVSSRKLGASPMLLMRILSGNIFLGALVGRNGFGPMTSTGGVIFLLCTAVTGLAIIIACAVKSEAPMKYFLLFTALLLTISLTRPHGISSQGNNGVADDDGDERYSLLGDSIARLLWAMLWSP